MASALALVSVLAFAVPPLAATSLEVDCASIRDSGRIMVVLAFGQSNAANSGLVRKESGHRVFSFANGRCYRARDPLPGATGRGGSIWTRFGDIAIGKGLADAVLIVPIAVGATMARDWSPGGRVHHRLVEGLRGPLATGFEFTHLLWMQGEHDAINKTPRKAYFNEMTRMIVAIRSGGIKAPIFVSQTTMCGSASSEAVRRAQRQIAEERKDVFPGPDTDAIGRKYRFDGCHLSEEGLEEAARAWIKAISAAKTD